MSQTDNQPTRTPPTEPGYWEWTSPKGDRANHVYVSQSGGKLYANYCCGGVCHEHPLEDHNPGYWRRSPPLEPFAPKLPVVELLEHDKWLAVRVGPKAFIFDSESFVASYYTEDLPKAYPHLHRTHVCKWEPTDE